MLEDLLHRSSTPSTIIVTHGYAYSSLRGGALILSEPSKSMIAATVHTIDRTRTTIILWYHIL